MLTNSEKVRVIDYFNSILKDFYKESDKSNHKVHEEKLNTIDDILYVFGYEIIGCSEEGTQIIRIFPKVYSGINIEKDLKYLYSDIIDGFYSSENRYIYKSKLEVFNRVLELLGYEIQGYGENSIIFRSN